jgi:hypothetical protein
MGFSGMKPNLALVGFLGQFMGKKQNSLLLKKFRFHFSYFPSPLPIY